MDVAVTHFITDDLVTKLKHIMAATKTKLASYSTKCLGGMRAADDVKLLQIITAKHSLPINKLNEFWFEVSICQHAENPYQSKYGDSWEQALTESTFLLPYIVLNQHDRTHGMRVNQHLQMHNT